MSHSLQIQACLDSLPPLWKGEPATDTSGALEGRRHKLVVLDDDPTGTQTVHGIPVLTDWKVEQLRSEFENDLPCFYLLTNSRSLPDHEARQLTQSISRSLKQAAGNQHTFTVVSRSDSTLRGHFPAETDVLQAELGPFDATLLIPFFEAGGRYTIHDTHYVLQDDQLVPAAETPFAKDSVFGYQNSNLKAWVEEKTKGRVTSEEVHSLSLDCIRTKGPEGVLEQLRDLKNGTVCIVNAAHTADLNVVAKACQQASKEGLRFLYRTGAQWVSSWLNLEPHIVRYSGTAENEDSAGGLIIVGSYVPVSSRQLSRLRGQPDLVEIECSVHDFLNETRCAERLKEIVLQMNEALSLKKNVVIFTSRDLITQGSSQGDLNIGNQVSHALVQIVKNLRLQPRFLIAKGGITSNDIATHGLGVKRAMVLGQAHPGIPVWELGPETNYPGMHYIVFPGNVGTDDTLLHIYQKLNP